MVQLKSVKRSKVDGFVDPLIYDYCEVAVHTRRTGMWSLLFTKIVIQVIFWQYKSRELNPGPQLC